MRVNVASLTQVAATLTAAALCSSPVILLASNQQAFPIVPRTSIEAGAVSSAGIVGADTLIPIWGDTDSRILFADLEAQYDTQHAFAIGPGVGLRQKLDDHILGGYVFGDFTRTDDNGHFWVINPGLEWLSTQWDVRVNGYFPITHRSSIENLGFAFDNGVYKYTSFTGHSGFDQNLYIYDVASNGVDASVGIIYPSADFRSRLQIGAYYYAGTADVSAIKGIMLGVEIPLNARASFVVDATYDNIFKTKGLVTLRYTFGDDINELSRDIRDQMRARIVHNIAAVDTAASIPTQESVQNDGHLRLYSDVIWFFTPGPSSAVSVNRTECTFENPCGGFNQNVINSVGSIDPAALLYLKPGNYYSATGSTTPAVFTLGNGMSIWGRTANYKAPSSGADRAILNGPVNLPGNNILDSVQVFNNTVQETLGGYGLNIVGVNVLAGSSGPIGLNNINVLVNDLVTSNGAFNLFLNGSSAVTLNNSTLTVTENTPATVNGAENIVIFGHNNLTLNKNVLNATDTGTGNTFGIYIPTGALSITTVNNTTFNILDNGVGSGAFGIYLDSHTSTVTVNNSIFNTTALDLTSPYGSNGILFTDSIASGALGTNIAVNNSTFNITNAGDGGANGVKMSNSLTAAASMSITNSLFNVVDNGGIVAASGVVLQDLGSLSITNTIMNIQETGGNYTGAFGVQVLGGGILQLSDSHLTMVDNGTNGATAVIMMGTGSATLDNLTISVIETGSGSATGTVMRGGAATITLSDSSVTATAMGSGLASGVVADGTNGTITIDNTNFSISALSGNASGLEIINAGASNINISDSTFKQISSNVQALGVLNTGTGLITSLNTNYTIMSAGTALFSGGGNVSQSGGVCKINGVISVCP